MLPTVTRREACVHSERLRRHWHSNRAQRHSSLCSSLSRDVVSACRRFQPSPRNPCQSRHGSLFAAPELGGFFLRYGRPMPLYRKEFVEFAVAIGGDGAFWNWWPWLSFGRVTSEFEVLTHRRFHPFVASSLVTSGVDLVTRCLPILFGHDRDCDASSACVRPLVMS